jgi:hypothetical protein
MLVRDCQLRTAFTGSFAYDVSQCSATRVPPLPSPLAVMSGSVSVRVGIAVQWRWLALQAIALGYQPPSPDADQPEWTTGTNASSSSGSGGPGSQLPVDSILPPWITHLHVCVVVDSDLSPELEWHLPAGCTPVVRTQGRWEDEAKCVQLRAPSGFCVPVTTSESCAHLQFGHSSVCPRVALFLLPHHDAVRLWRLRPMLVPWGCTRRGPA